MGRTNYYRECSLVGEGVIPPEASIIVSPAPNGEVAKGITGVLGENTFVDGISVRSPTWLLESVSMMRSRVLSTVDSITGKLDDISSKYYKKERKITTAIANLHSDPREELVPGFWAVLVSGFAGKVLTRNRGLFMRATAPMILGIGAFSYFLPSTFKNTKELCYALEKGAFPRFVESQDKAVVGMKKTVGVIVNTSASIYRTTTNAYCKSVKVFRDWTGLNV
ncbi:HBL271Wp [Eremothecium sinecaudum]|uniref:MICOS complex subunit n=1 Tax=Eremothecium sinecaudum TaxID=45286 RepID=A0A120K0T1_9SACH|nr:HBL271Wp [Eremothecium sinecaudum]AMD18631.1 HBL271Wp [Eremothecium sinecaudum]